MTFKEAKDELKRLAEGRYHSISYELIEDSRGELLSECRLYIDPRISSLACSTWEEAFTELKKNLYPREPIRAYIPLSEMPE